MAFGGSKQRPRIGKRIKDMQDTGRQLHTLVRRKSTPVNISVGAIASVGADSTSGQNDSESLPTGGGTMIGPIAFFPALVTIGDGYIDIGKNTDDFSSRIIVSPESGTTDNLYTILNAAHAGQLLFLQGVAGNTITIRDANESGTAWATSTGYIAGVVVSDAGELFVCHTGHTSSASDQPDIGANWEDYWYKANFETLDGGPQTLTDDDIFIFQFDTTDNHWQQITKGKQTNDNTKIIDGDTEVSTTDATPKIDFILDGVNVAQFNKDGSSIERLLMATGCYLDMNGETIDGVDVMTPHANGVIRPTDESVFHAFTGFIGFACGSTDPDLSAASNVGCMQIPYKESTDSSPSAATLNDWFGDQNGCIGIQYDSSASAGSKNNLWGKINFGWQRFVQF